MLGLSYVRRVPSGQLRQTVWLVTVYVSDLSGLMWFLPVPVDGQDVSCQGELSRRNRKNHYSLIVGQQIFCRYLGSRIYHGTENLISGKKISQIMLLIHCEIVLLAVTIHFRRVMLRLLSSR